MKREFVVYRLVKTKDSPIPLLPNDLTFIEWNQSAFRLFPPGLVAQHLGFIKNWIYFFIPMLRSGKSFYKIDTITRGSQGICQCIVTPRTRRFEFMGNEDLQIGLVFATPKERNKGITSKMIATIVNMAPIGQIFWWVTTNDNKASIIIAERAGFKFVDKAFRSNFLDFPSYRLQKKSSSSEKRTMTGLEPPNSTSSPVIDEKLNIWLIATGEPIPIENGRPHRMGMLAEKLIQMGHKVTWWASTFDHQAKAYRANSDKVLEFPSGLSLVLLHSSVKYKQNISILRLMNHLYVGHRFQTLTRKAQPPNAIFCSFPTIELSWAAVAYGKLHGVPVVIDVRDLWPDIFLSAFPSWSHLFLRLGLMPYRLATSYIFKHCKAITGISAKYLDWALTYRDQPDFHLTGIFPLSYQSHSLHSDVLHDCNDRLALFGIHSDKTLIWYVGTFGQTYDLEVPILAARKLADSRKDLQFVFSGEGEQGLAWRALASGLSNVVFTGWLENEMLTAIAGCAKVGLMAYRPDAPQGLPNKIFEYMSAGIPILSSLSGETRELIEKHEIGYFYDNNVDDFIKKLDLLVDDPSRLLRFGERAKQLFETNFSPDHVYSSLAKFITETAES